ncbi:MAG: hypothetical protein HC930_05140 [Hydrococcus sp. SU_1_0]|nr:hypothetical protein [Hydrococcus sp. SU_1_0]
MLNQELKVSPHGSFKVSQLCDSVAICEAVKGDRHNWNNGTDIEPAFVVYLGCSEAEISGYLKTINTFYRCSCSISSTGGTPATLFRASWSEIRKPKYLSDFEVEIKIRGMQRYADSYAFGLDYLVESETAKHIGCDSDEYDYHTTGTQQRW